MYASVLLRLKITAVSMEAAFWFLRSRYHFKNLKVCCFMKQFMIIIVGFVEKEILIFRPPVKLTAVELTGSVR